MKKTLLSLSAVIATAFVLQASNNRSSELPEYTVSAGRLQFIDTRLEAVVNEWVAKALAEPIPASVLASGLLRLHTTLASLKEPPAGEFPTGDHS